MADPSKYRHISEELCREMGGHCWESLPETALLTNPPRPVYHRQCRHCGKAQSGQQPVVIWTEGEK